MKIHTKLFLGLLLLFVVISLLAGIGGYAVYKLDKNVAQALDDNFVSADYAMNLLNTLERIQTTQYKLIENPTSKIINQDYQRVHQQFEYLLQSEAAKATKKNETDIISHLQSNYHNLIAKFDELQRNKTLSESTYKNFVTKYYDLVKKDIIKIYTLNKTEILNKSIYAKEVAQHHSILIITLGLTGVGTVFLFFLFFPARITHSLERLRLCLQAVANHDYSQHLVHTTNDELGLLAATFNKMVRSLKEHQESVLNQLTYCKERDKAVMNQLQEGVLILDENLKIVAINNLLARMMSIAQPQEWIGKYASDMAVKNSLMRKLIAPTVRVRISNGEGTLSENTPSSTRILCIEQQGQELAYQVTQKDFHVPNPNTKQFAGFIITVREFDNNTKMLGQMPVVSLVAQLQDYLEKWKQSEVDTRTLQHINQLIDTTRNFTDTLNGRLNPIN